MHSFQLLSVQLLIHSPHKHEHLRSLRTWTEPALERTEE